MSASTPAAPSAPSQNSVQGSVEVYTDAEPFRVETTPDARQKRKRTSPRDQTVLEAAYQKNSKPDKEERLQLVELVDLREKEVQIWFQNRRQNDRRKSKPLQPHELIPHFRNGVPIEAAKQLPSPKGSQSTTADSSSQQTTSQADPRPASSSPRPNNIHALLNNSDEPIGSSPTASTQKTPSTGKGVLATPPSTIERRVQDYAFVPTKSLIATSDPAPQIAKKRSHEQMNDGRIDVVAEEDSPKDAKTLRRTSSFVRLAVSADGSVKVRVNDEATPSPPQQRPAPPPNMGNRRSSGFTRAHSDLNFRDAQGPARGALGRSRDARTWEFYCDKSSRASLADRAEEEATGSAAGALGLMRSATQRRQHPLTSNASRQNNLRRSYSSLNTKPGLSRTHSSMARLQTSSSIVNELSNPVKPSLRRRISGSDSDKENWLPGTRDPADEQRISALHTQQESRSKIHGHGETRRRATAAPESDVHNKENRNRPTNGKAKVDDLDCVQGLLSLSQGAWR